MAQSDMSPSAAHFSFRRQRASSSSEMLASSHAARLPPSPRIRHIPFSPPYAAAPPRLLSPLDKRPRHVEPPPPPRRSALNDAASQRHALRTRRGEERFASHEEIAFDDDAGHDAPPSRSARVTPRLNARDRYFISRGATPPPPRFARQRQRACFRYASLRRSSPIMIAYTSKKTESHEELA